MCIFLCIAPIFQKWTKSFGMNGGDDGTRTRGLCRDSSLGPEKARENE